MDLLLSKFRDAANGLLNVITLRRKYGKPHVPWPLSHIFCLLAKIFLNIRNLQLESSCPNNIRNTLNLMFTDNVRLFTCLSLLLWQQHHVQSYAERQTISAPQQEKEVNRGAKFGSVAGTGWAVTGLQGVVRTLIAQLFPHPAWSCTTVTPQLYLKGAATCCVWPCCDLVSWGIEKYKKRAAACSCTSVASPPISYKEKPCRANMVTDLWRPLA